MAKKTTSKKTTVFEIPETHTPFLEIDPTDRDYVFVKMRVQRYPKVSLRKGAENPAIDVAQFAGSAATQKLWDYGLGRFCRDGAQARESIKGDDGKVTTREFTEAERIDSAESNAHKKVQALYGNRPLGSRSGGVSVLCREMRVAFVGYFLKKMHDAEGKAYKRNTVPSSIANGGSDIEIVATATLLGVPDRVCAALHKRAESIAKLREDTSDLEIEIEEG